MSDFIPKDGSGQLRKNDYKTKDAQPNAKGYIIAHRDIKKGEKVDLASWTKTDVSGNKYQSLKIQDVYVKPDEPQGDAPREDAPSEDIPF
jgi:hypothetical protein